MAWFTDPSLPDLGQAQEGALMSINAMQRTAPGVTPLAAFHATIAPHGVAQGARHPARR